MAISSGSPHIAPTWTLCNTAPAVDEPIAHRLVYSRYMAGSQLAVFQGARKALISERLLSIVLRRTRNS